MGDLFSDQLRILTGTSDSLISRYWLLFWEQAFTAEGDTSRRTFFIQQLEHLPRNQEKVLDLHQSEDICTTISTTL